MIESTTMSTREPLMTPFGETLQLQRAIRASDGSQRHSGKNACEGRPQGASDERGSGAAARARHPAACCNDSPTVCSPAFEVLMAFLIQNHSSCPDRVDLGDDPY
jgi:hypothetical protein